MNRHNFNWNATSFFEELVAKNKLAIEEKFTFCRVSGLDGFEEALDNIQSSASFVCISDISNGYTELNNTPRTRRVKTVFLAMRHAVDNMEARQQCMDTMRELFRQFMSVLIQERTKLEQHCIYLDPRITFNEIDRYFFSGCACAYFQIAVDIFTDLRYDSDEWRPATGELWLTEVNGNTMPVIRLISAEFGCSLAAAKSFVNGAPCIIAEEVSLDEYLRLKPMFENTDANVELR